MSEELKPCPFCGGECDATGWLRGDGTRGPECEGCGATAASVEDWNRRAQPAEAEGVEVVGYRVSMPGEPELGTWLDEEEESEPQIQHHEPLMTVAQHQRILSAVTAERDAHWELLQQVTAFAARAEAERDQLRAEVDALRKDAALGSVVQRACRDLPEGFIITVWLEKDAGTLELCLPDTDAALDDFDGDTFAEQISNAIDAAMAAKEGA